ncbi:hypothetical protein D3C87_1739350 [compost metagenome]
MVSRTAMTDAVPITAGASAIATYGASSRAAPNASRLGRRPPNQRVLVAAATSSQAASVAPKPAISACTALSTEPACTNIQ